MPFSIIRNDITKIHVDAIVNAANKSLLGGGVDGAIHRAAGPQLLAECRTLHGCETGEAKITRGYHLPAKYVIHTVGPIWRGGTHNERALLSACYRNSLALALERGCTSVAFPLISAGAYGYPKDQAIDVAISTISQFLDELDESTDLTVYLVVFGSAEFNVGKTLFDDIQSYIDDVYVDEHTQRNLESRRASLWHEDEVKALQLDSSLSAPLPTADAPMMADTPTPNWEELLRTTDEGFSESLLHLIDKKGMTDAQCYKRANIDRKLFSKIRSNPAYKPSKSTALAFAIALELTLPEAEALLRKAGFAISHSSKFDIIVEYFLKAGSYNIHEINEVLFQFDMPLLGSVT